MRIGWPGTAAFWSPSFAVPPRGVCETDTRSACPKTPCKPAVTRELALVLAAMPDDDS
jgi:hypothetical protein